MPDYLAHAALGDLDAVTRPDLSVALVFVEQVVGHRLEAVARYLDARGEAHDRGLKHTLVGRLGLDQYDVHARIALLPHTGQLMQTSVTEQLEGLIADLGEAHIGDPARRGTVAPVLAFVHEWNDRIDDDHERRPGLHGDVKVRGRDDAPVDQLAVADLDRRVDHR